jgi:hypothetical protein
MLESTNCYIFVTLDFARKMGFYLYFNRQLGKMKKIRRVIALRSNTLFHIGAPGCDRQEKCDPRARKKLIHQRQEKTDPLRALCWKKSEPPIINKSTTIARKKS